MPFPDAATARQAENHFFLKKGETDPSSGRASLLFNGLFLWYEFFTSGLL
jgi:hypothetical protein